MPAVALVLASCDFVSDGYDATIQTDQQRYELTDRPVGLTLTIKNVGEKSIYLVCGGATGLEEWADGKLRHAWGRIGYMCLHVDRIAPGEEFVIKRGVSYASFPGEPAPELSDRVEYRVGVSIFEDEDVKKPVDEDDQRSNAFVIVQAAGSSAS